MSNNRVDMAIVRSLLCTDHPDLNIRKIAEESDISRTAFYNKRDDLIERGLIKKSRKMGNSKLYKLGENAEDYVSGTRA